MRSVKSESRILIISNKLIRFHLKNSLNKKKSLNKLFDQNFLIKNILKYLQKLIITKQYITYYYIILTGFEYHFAKIINLSNTFHCYTRQGWETLSRIYSCLALVGNPTWSYPDREQVHARYFLPNP